MTHHIQRLFEKDEFLAAGLMSGTSMDGIDAALVRLPADARDPAVELVAFEETPYPVELKDTLREIAYGEQCTAEDIATLHTSVAVAFANGLNSLCRKVGVNTSDVDFVGSHGQTVAHVPPVSGGLNLISGTLQLGPPGMIAALTGMTTVGDFRGADMALGGQGAPLAPYADFLLRRSDVSSRLILNIGGIANLTLLPKSCGPDEVLAFDTGPGNMILDELYRVLHPDEADYEKLAERLTDGEESASLVGTFLDFSYFERKPPKSAGHREFGGRYAWEFMSKAEASAIRGNDILASALALTTQSIKKAITDFVEPIGGADEVFVSGGGSRNAVMMNQLRALLSPAEVRPIDDLGIPAAAKEAVDFAVLAREAMLSRVNVLHRATGATKSTVLGTIAWGSDS